MAGRPRRTFTKTQVAKIDRMAKQQCKDHTIADALGIPLETFKGHFRERTHKKRAEGKVELHAAQWRQRTNCTMAIWLGKQYLGQSDQASVQHGVDKSFLDAMKELAGNGNGNGRRNRTDAGR